MPAARLPLPEPPAEDVARLLELLADARGEYAEATATRGRIRAALYNDPEPLPDYYEQRLRVELAVADYRCNQYWQVATKLVTALAKLGVRA
jgi:hypothetical protein